MYYKESIFITEPVGNNAISYEERKALGSEGKIYVPAIVSGSVSDVSLGHQIVFEEIENGKLISCVGLESLVMCVYKDIPVCIVDNHNHVLYFRYQALQQSVITS